MAFSEMLSFLSLRWQFHKEWEAQVASFSSLNRVEVNTVVSKTSIQCGINRQDILTTQSRVQAG
jgi:hypothetical protein